MRCHCFHPVLQFKISLISFFFFWRVVTHEGDSAVSGQQDYIIFFSKVNGGVLCGVHIELYSEEIRQSSLWTEMKGQNKCWVCIKLRCPILVAIINFDCRNLTVWHRNLWLSEMVKRLLMKEFILKCCVGIFVEKNIKKSHSTFQKHCTDIYSKRLWVQKPEIVTNLNIVNNFHYTASIIFKKKKYFS